MHELQKFRSLFGFNPAYALRLGVERECHLARGGRIVPLAPQVVPWLQSRVNGRSGCYGYELSATQLEERTSHPCELREIAGLFSLNEQEIERAERELDFGRVFVGAAPEDMPLDIYPDARYLRITQGMPIETIRAACRVAGVHVLVGMPDAETAMRAYNHVVGYFDQLCEMGSTEERLVQYRRAAKGLSARMKLFQTHLMTSFRPPVYQGWEEFYERATQEGFVDDPRRLWDFIRLSRHGAIEFRMFDTTGDMSTIISWAEFCQKICIEAL